MVLPTRSSGSHPIRHTTSVHCCTKSVWRNCFCDGVWFSSAGQNPRDL